MSAWTIYVPVEGHGPANIRDADGNLVATVHDVETARMMAACREMQDALSLAARYLAEGDRISTDPDAFHAHVRITTAMMKAEGRT